ncbi:hypothetical protein [Dokdonella sp.]|uniref:hypothetical protein n=1 Tax=Dokdonella sp. TaxID=2291710 RepID=UPI0031C71810|nr:hypothetical protein [Dokdonella sp.]
MGTRGVAADWPGDLQWVNTPQPPELAGLRGHVVLVWFWSFDQVNCWNVAHALARLERKYYDGLAVVGMHCPKYPYQHAIAPVLQAVNRLGIRHPVASDPEFRVWREHEISAWPSMLLIDATGRVAARYSGEGTLDPLDAHIAALLDEAAMQDARSYEPVAPALRPEPRTALAFPSGLLIERERIWVADSGHGRVLECNRSGRILRSFGGAVGMAGGAAPGRGLISDPRGLAACDDAICVADAGSHSILSIDRASGEVQTMLGTGVAGHARPQGAGADATPINTPLGLAVMQQRLFVTLAGQHQVWMIDRASGTVSVLAGSGEPGLVDGPGAEARLAQPSGLAVLGSELVLADAAASALRTVDAAGQVATLVGQGLYVFGDAAGTRESARLQNPLAVAADPRGIVYLADSYNNAIKLFDRRSGKLHALPLRHELAEPQALALAPGRLWIANTNRHEILAVDLASGTCTRVPVGEM